MTSHAVRRLSNLPITAREAVDLLKLKRALQAKVESTEQAASSNSVRHRLSD
jgi:hypothetical protein